MSDLELLSNDEFLEVFNLPADYFWTQFRKKEYEPKGRFFKGLRKKYRENLLDNIQTGCIVEFIPNELIECGVKAAGFALMILISKANAKKGMGLNASGGSMEEFNSLFAE